MFKQNRNDPYIINFARNVASGGVAGAISLSVLYSLDFARTRLANDVKSTTNGATQRKFNGLVDVYRKTLAADGIAGLYRGFFVACAGVFVYRGCYFGLYDTLKPMLLDQDASLNRSFLLGYGVTIASSLLSYPLDTIERRMMMTSGEPVKYKGSLDCMLQILRIEGALAFYKGAGITIVRSIAGAGVLAGFDKLVVLYTSIKVDSSGGG